jgi:hypothetical protein
MRDVDNFEVQVGLGLAKIAGRIFIRFLIDIEPFDANPNT